MQCKKYVLAAAVMITCAAGLVAHARPAAPVVPAAATTFATPDAAFLALREAAGAGDAEKAARLSAQVPADYLPSYVDYYRLKPRLQEADAAEVRDFLERYAGSAIADRLRNDWLRVLGQAGEWADFDEQYAQFVLNDDVQVKCFALASRLFKGQHVAGDARALLVSPKDYGQACSELILALVQARQFSQNDLWAQIRQALEAGNVSLAQQLAVAVGGLQRALDKPALVLAHGPGQGRVAHELYLVAVGRVAKANPQQAALLLGNAVGLTAQEQALAWAQVALAASFKLLPEAIDYWRKSGGAPLSHEAWQWKARIALRAGDWKMAKATIKAMPSVLRNEITWVYWLGRAQEGQAASALFESIASHTSFYGQLAAEELGQKIVIPPGPVPPTPEEIAPMEGNPGFQRALKFYALDLRHEGNREWNWELRKMNDRQLLAAAEFARQSDVLERMISTSSRTRLEMDFTQRFPAPHLNEMRANTQALGLEYAWVYGLIRQESRFIKNARSYVGASGLMQLMPSTAKYVARKIGLTGFLPGQINDLDTNLLLGASYLNMVLTNLDGSQTLATAAYNAGPGRPRAWRSTLSRMVEGAIFVESIPFSETRTYVKNVMSNASYYAALFENQPQSLKERLGMVAPRADMPTDLP